MTLNKFLDPAKPAKKGKSLEEITLLFQDDILFTLLKLPPQYIRQEYKELTYVSSKNASVFYWLHEDSFVNFQLALVMPVLLNWMVLYDVTINFIATDKGSFFYIWRNQDLL
jgi:hypothetical protein